MAEGSGRQRWQESSLAREAALWLVTTAFAQPAAAGRTHVRRGNDRDSGPPSKAPARDQLSLLRADGSFGGR